jgi:hypothetical protein
MQKGDLVTYIPFPEAPKSKWVQGKVKSVHPNTNDILFVVFRCNDEWDDYEKYTSQATNLKNLKPGWITDETDTTFE